MTDDEARATLADIDERIANATRCQLAEQRERIVLALSRGRPDDLPYAAKLGNAIIHHLNACAAGGIEL